MAEDKREQELTELQDITWIRGLLGNVSGKITASLFQKIILGHRYRISSLETDDEGAGILEPNVGIVFAYDSNDISKYLIYAYFRKSGEYANRIVITANGISLGAHNNQGTSVIIGGDTQLCINLRK